MTQWIFSCPNTETNFFVVGCNFHAFVCKWMKTAEYNLHLALQMLSVMMHTGLTVNYFQLKELSSLSEINTKSVNGGDHFTIIDISFNCVQILFLIKIYLHSNKCIDL